MDIRNKLLNLFTKDCSYFYHLVKTNEPVGHLVYIMKSDSTLDTDSLEFTTTKIAEELAKDCEIKLEKFAPGVYFSEESDTSELKSKLNCKFEENEQFSSFVEYIKEKYRILEIKDSLLYKFDPNAYEEARRKEYEENQQALIEKLLDQIQNQKSEREQYILSYENNLIKLLKDYLKDVIEFEKRDFTFENEFEKFINNLIDDDPFIGNINISSLEEDTINVLLTNDHFYTATYRLDKDKVVMENFVEIQNEIPILTDYEILSKLYEVDINTIDWETKSETERLYYVIDHLVPIFHKKKEEEEEEWYKKIKEENSDEFEEDEENDEFKDEDDGYNKSSYSNSNPNNFYFDVRVDDEPSMIVLVEVSFWNKNHYWDDQLGSHNLSKSVKDALIRAGVYGYSELAESIWEVLDGNRTKEDIIDSMVREGFIYNQEISN